MKAPETGTSRPTPVIGVPLVAGASLPLAFIVTGLGFLLASLGALVASPDVLLLPSTHPHLVAHVHLWLPGFLLTVSMGATYQMMPVVLGTTLATSTRSAWLHLALHTSGIVALVAGFALGRFEIVAIGGTVVTLGVGCFVRTVWTTFRAGRRRDAQAWCFPLSAGWLLVTVLMGVFMAINRRWDVIGASPLVLLRAHAHLGLVGFFLTLLQGATFQLIPMFTMGAVRRPALITTSVIASQSGLALLSLGWLVGAPTVSWAGAIGLAAALACAGVALVATLHARTRRKLEPGIRSFLTGMVMLVPAAAVGVALLSGQLPGDRGTVLYGLLLIPGALAFAVLGMLCKIVPFLVWMRTYGPRVGRETVPSATRLGSRRLELTWQWIHLVALAILAPAIVMQLPRLATAGLWLLTSAILLFVGNVARVLDHMRHPRVSATAAPVSGRATTAP